MGSVEQGFSGVPRTLIAMVVFVYDDGLLNRMLA
jgi:hypothetical protein